MIGKATCDKCGQMVDSRKDDLIKRANQLIWSVTNYPCSMSPECCEEVKALVVELKRICK